MRHFVDQEKFTGDAQTLECQQRAPGPLVCLPRLLPRRALCRAPRDAGSLSRLSFPVLRRGDIRHPCCM